MCRKVPSICWLICFHIASGQCWSSYCEGATWICCEPSSTVDRHPVPSNQFRNLHQLIKKVLFDCNTHVIRFLCLVFAKFFAFVESSYIQYPPQLFILIICIIFVSVLPRNPRHSIKHFGYELFLLSFLQSNPLIKASN